MTTDFGRDTLCLDSLRTGRSVTGVRRVAQNCYHRLITPRGTLRGGADEGNFGLDLAGKVGSAVTQALQMALPGQIDNELRKDPRVLSTTVAIVWTTTTAGEVSAEIAIEVQTAAGPFELVLAVDGVSAKIVRLVV
jgi:hypothetical protein